MNDTEKSIRPEDWHNIPKCVVEATRFLLDKQKFLDTRMNHQVQMLQRMEDSTARKEAKVQRKFDDLVKSFNS